MRSMPWLRVDWAEGEKMELPPSLGPGTKLGLLGHLLTCIGIAQHVGRSPLCIARPYLIKEFIKRALILILNIHHALK